MKGIKFVVIPAFLVIILLGIYSSDVKASEFADMNTLSELSIKATVPEEYNDDVAIEFLQESTQVKFTAVLSKENNYCDIISVVNNSTYAVTAVAEKGYITDMANRYEVRGEKVQLQVNVKKDVLSDLSMENSRESSSGEQNALSNDIKAAEDILNEYLESVSFAKNDKAFDSFFALYGGSMFFEYYLQIDSMNTRDAWDNMSDFDRFNHYITYTMPSVKLMNYSYTSSDEFISELISQKNMLLQITNGEKVYYEISKVWEWLFDYWNYTGTVYNFYDYYAISEKESQEEDMQMELLQDEIVGSTFSEVVSEISITKTDKVIHKDVFMKILKRNFISICIFIVLIVFLAVILYMKKEDKKNDF